MSTWRPFTDYSPLAQVLVQYMWDQRPPLLPAQFATKVGVSRQSIARVLNQDAHPEPAALLQMARVIGVPSQRLFFLAGYTTEADPIFTTEEAWDMVFSLLQSSQVIDDEHRHGCLETLGLLRSSSAKQNEGTSDRYSA